MKIPTWKNTLDWDNNIWSDLMSIAVGARSVGYSFFTWPDPDGGYRVYTTDRDKIRGVIIVPTDFTSDDVNKNTLEMLNNV